MSIRIDGGVVVGWAGTGHEFIANASVLIDGGEIKSVGTDRSQPADKVIQRSQSFLIGNFRKLRALCDLL